MSRRVRRSVRGCALALLAALALVTAGPGPGRPLPARAAPPALPSDRLHFGVTNGDQSLGWMTGSGVPWRYRYVYLAGGVNVANDWTTWQDPALPPGQYAVDYMNASSTAPANYIPVLTWYQLLQSSPSTGANESDRDYNNLNNVSTMASYYSSFRLLLQRAGAYGKTVVIHVEPDFWGYMQQRSGNGMPSAVVASVQSSGFSDVSGYANTVAGFGLALIHLRDLYAPKAVMAIHASAWSSSIDIASNSDPAVNAAAEADKTAAFLNAAGAWDVVFNDVDDHDAAWWEAQGSPVHWMDPTNLTLPNFSRYLAWVAELRTRTGRPQLVWQVPEGNQYYLTMNNTCGHYQDTVAQYFISHASDLYAAGLIGVLFGGYGCQTTHEDAQKDGVTNNGGVPTTDLRGWCNQCNTHISSSSDDDGGYIRTFVGLYYATPPPVGVSASRTTRTSYQLSASQPDRSSTWYEVDPNLRTTVTFAAGQAALLGANMDLWTTATGYNQDLGIFLGTDCALGNLLGWKESGGYAGTYSPNAAFVQAIDRRAPGTYTYTLCWKANQSAPPGTVFGAAGTAGTEFSPTTLTVTLLPSANLASVGATASYSLASQQPDSASTWYEIDATLRLDYVAPAAGSVVLGGNIDLWTATAGYNQDVGLFRGDCGLGHLLAWKESGGFAGTFSPNAAFVEAVVSVAQNEHVQARLCWKANRSAPAGTVYGAAGTADTYFSPTRLTAEFVPGAAAVASLAQVASYRLDWQQPDASSTWHEIDPALRVSITAPAAGQPILLGANADLWTAAAGYNQDIGIFSGTDCLAAHLLAWKESGGFAGTFSPNAAYVQARYLAPGAGSQLFTLCWKANQVAPPGTVFAGAGTAGTYFSQTRLTAQLTS